MKASFQKLVIGLSALLLLASIIKSGAFALLGPIQPWMQASNGVINPSDIGGPMLIGSGYRWNVPVVTYGFDQSFLNYFGSNGVAAVESAIQILNGLPPASQVVLTNYPLYTQWQNYEAESLSLYDLKSQTLSLLLEHLGLAQPTRNIFVLKQWTPTFLSSPSENDWFNWAVPDFIDQRNFDPQTTTASTYVNSTLYTADVLSYAGQNYISMLVVDPLQSSYNAVADGVLNQGGFYTGLTYDDVGGLAYLLSTNNFNFESLLPGVHGAGGCAYVNSAVRPGVDKVTFVRVAYSSLEGQLFTPFTNQYTDTFFSNSVVMHQQLERVVTQPDFLFSAADFGASFPLSLALSTGTTNWLNNAAANGNTNGAGPGVIPPQIQIIFNKLPGQEFFSVSDEQVAEQSQIWGSFDDSTNTPIIYPQQPAGSSSLLVRMWLSLAGQKTHESFTWQPTNPPGTFFVMQTSTNLVNWTTLFTVMNYGNVCTYFNNNPASARRFYRLIPQQLKK